MEMKLISHNGLFQTVRKNKPKKKEDYSYNIPVGQSKFSYELTYSFISIENGGKQKKAKIP